MPDGYELHDGRFLCEAVSQSAADAISLWTLPCPANKVWTILSASYYPSAAETRTVHWCVLSRAGLYYPISVPVAIALSMTILYPLVTEGMEIKLFPGESLNVRRDVATAGSSMTIRYRYIETDLPFYSYAEPLNKVVKSAQRHGSTFRATGGISPGGSGSGGGIIGGGHPSGGGGGGAEPV